MPCPAFCLAEVSLTGTEWAAVGGFLVTVGGGIGWLIKVLLAELKRKDDQITELATKFDATVNRVGDKFDTTVQNIGDRVEKITTDNRAEHRETTQTMLTINRELVSTIGANSAVLTNVVGKVDRLDERVQRVESGMEELKKHLDGDDPPPKPKRGGS
jgi:methyl-accepting chemotaxis protein